MIFVIDVLKSKLSSTLQKKKLLVTTSIIQIVGNLNRWESDLPIAVLFYFSGFQRFPTNTFGTPENVVHFSYFEYNTLSEDQI